MVIHSNGQNFLGSLLADDVFVENAFDLLRLGQLVAPCVAGVLELLADNVVAKLDAFIADKD